MGVILGVLAGFWTGYLCPLWVSRAVVNFGKANLSSSPRNTTIAAGCNIFIFYLKSCCICRGIKGWGGGSYIAGRQLFMPTCGIYNSHWSEQLRVCDFRNGVGSSEISEWEELEARGKEKHSRSCSFVQKPHVLWGYIRPIKSLYFLSLLYVI